VSATLNEITTPRPSGAPASGQFAADIPDGWQQGRGAFGGLVLGLLSRAIQAHAAAGGAPRPLRSLTAELCGPVLPGDAEIRVETLRAGSGTQTIAARILQRGEVQSHAVAVLGRHRSVNTDLVGLPRPSMPPWRGVAPFDQGPAAPPFVRHMEYRPTGPVGFGGGDDPVVSGWVRPRAPGPARDEAYLVALADAWWPSIFPRLRAPRPMATISFTIDIVGNCDGLDPDAPLYHDARTLASSGGYVVELRSLWGEDGRLLSLNHQTLVVIQ
jgi:acyl-Coa thioesterase superfamily protein/acyl-CoA thioesterase superfamily protein